MVKKALYITLIALLGVQVGTISTNNALVNKEQQLVQSIEKIDGYTVLIRLDNTFQSPIGSGVSIVRGDAQYVWTDYHVVEVAIKKKMKLKVEKNIVEDDRIVSTFNTEADIIAINPNIDIALLKLKTTSPTIKNAKFYLDEELLPRGTDVVIVGNFLDYGTTVGMTGASPGTIGGYSHWLGGQKFDIIHNGAVIGGCSGSGVFLPDGRCIGLTCRMYNPSSLLYSPIREIKKWAVEKDLMWALR